VSWAKVVGAKVSPNSLLLTILVVWLSGCAGINGNQLATDSADISSARPSPARNDSEFVYVANLGVVGNGHGSISAFTIDGSSGALTPVPGSPFLVDDHPGAITAGPQGHHLFVLEKKFSLGGEVCTHVKGVLLSEAVHRNGVLSLADRVTLDGSCPASAVTDRAGKYLYVAMLKTDAVQRSEALLSEIQVFAMLPGGKLKEIPGSPFQLAPPLQTLAMHPDGKWLYAATADDRNGILALPRDPQTGALGTALTAAARPQSRLAIVPPDDLMIADTPATVDQISVLKIDESSGKLALQFTAPAVLPWGFSVHPSGQFVAVAATQPTLGAPGEVLLYRIDATTGSLTPLAGSAATGNGSFDVKFDPRGRFVYATAMNDNTINGFVFDSTSGKLAPVPGSPFAVGDSPVELAVVRPK
jgi:6-phosphogluconolactonase (cycloisomerase 2 family)